MNKNISCNLLEVILQSADTAPSSTPSNKVDIFTPHVHSVGKVSALSLWNTNHNGTPRIWEVREVSANQWKLAWDAGFQQSSIYFNFVCFHGREICNPIVDAASKQSLVYVDLCIFLAKHHGTQVHHYYG